MLNIVFGKNPFEEKVNDLWFEKFSFINPVEARLKWVKWILKNKEKEQKEKLLKLFQIVTGLTTTISNYFYEGKQAYEAKEGKVRYYTKLGEEKSIALELLMMSLDIIPPNNRERRQLSNPKNRIVILTEFSSLPSLYYHKEVIKGIMDKAKDERLIPIIQEISKENLVQTLISLSWNCFPHGIVFLRISPDKQTLKYLWHLQRPVIFIHPKQIYEGYSIIQNIIPIYDDPNENPQLSFDFIKYLEKKNITSDKKVVIAHMNHEDDKYRGKRVAFINRILEYKNITPFYFEVQDYNFHHAYKLLKAHPEADVYICLSDQIAVALKHIFEAINIGENIKNRIIIGFDDSQLARDENITSFGQFLTKRENDSQMCIGEESLHYLKTRIEYPKASANKSQIKKNVYLAIRD